MTATAHALYLREWKIANPEKVAAQRLRHNERRKGKPRATRRKNPQAECALCEIFLVSKYGGKLRRKYCDFCMEQPRVRRFLNRLYTIRHYRKKKGLPAPKVDWKNLTYILP